MQRGPLCRQWLQPSRSARRGPPHLWLLRWWAGTLDITQRPCCHDDCLCPQARAHSCRPRCKQPQALGLALQTLSCPGILTRRIASPGDTVLDASLDGWLKAHAGQSKGSFEPARGDSPADVLAAALMSGSGSRSAVRRRAAAMTRLLSMDGEISLTLPRTKRRQRGSSHCMSAPQRSAVSGLCRGPSVGLRQCANAYCWCGKAPVAHASTTRSSL